MAWIKRQAQTALLTEDLHEWLPAYCKLSHIGGRRELTLEQLLHNVVLSCIWRLFAIKARLWRVAWSVAGKVCRLVRYCHRCQFPEAGFGKQLVLNILAWGKRMALNRLIFKSC